MTSWAGGAFAPAERLCRRQCVGAVPCERVKTTTRNTLGVAVAAAVAALLLAIPWWLGDRDAGVSDLATTPGSDELEQIFGQLDGDTPPDASVDTDASAAADLSSSVRGQVIRPTGEPSPGAVVVAQATGTEQRFETVADAGGLFAIDGLPDGRYVIEASHEGYGPAIALGVYPGDPDVRLVLQAGRSITGIVLHDDEPVSNAVVHLGGPGTFPQRSVVADASGQFRLDGVRPGRYEIVATSPGLGTGFGGRIAIDDTTNAEPITIELPAAEAPLLTLDVVDAATDDPVVTGVVTVAEAQLHVLSLSTLIANGVAVLDVLPPDTYAVRVRAPGYLPWTGEIVVPGTDSDVRIELSQGATVRGTVRDAASNPLSRVQITAVVETPEGGRWELRRSMFDDFHRLVRPDGTPFWLPSLGFDSREDGGFVLTGLPAGTAIVTASMPGYADAISPQLMLTTDVVYEPLELVLRPGRSIRGRVEDAGGGGVADAYVSVRPPTVPAWASTRGMSTDSIGGFRLDDVPGEVTLTVRHPDFAVTEVTLEVPEQGLDDVVIRLSGEQLPAVSGRVFTARGRPAIGARVWVMHGDNELPACRAAVAVDGWFHATHCTAAPERLIASYPDHAPLIADLGGDPAPRDWTLSAGGEIEIVTQRTPLVIRVEPGMQLPAAHWARPTLDLDRWSRQVIEHVAPGSYRVTCGAEGYGEQVIDVDVSTGERVEVLCPWLERLTELPLWVVDHTGAPVPNALVFVDGLTPPVRELTGARGNVTLSTEPGVWLTAEAMHERWGRGALTFYVPWEEPDDPMRIVLETGIAGAEPEAFLARLQDWGVEAVTDGRSVVIDEIGPESPASGLGLRRRDLLLWARPVSEHRFSIGVRRSDEILTFDLAREPAAEPSP